MTDKELMSFTTAVFNGHVNNASDKADAEFVRMFGVAKFNRHIKPYHDEGIMSLFERDNPNQYQTAWVAMVTVMVNQGGIVREAMIEGTYDLLGAMAAGVGADEGDTLYFENIEEPVYLVDGSDWPTVGQTYKIMAERDYDGDLVLRKIKKVR